jgi:hypothetical protein
MKYAFYSDPENGWLKISIKEINQIAITQDISTSNFKSTCGKYVFLRKILLLKSLFRQFSMLTGLKISRQSLLLVFRQ